MSSRSQVYNYSAILRDRVQGLIALVTELEGLRFRLRQAEARTMRRRGKLSTRTARRLLGRR